MISTIQSWFSHTDILVYAGFLLTYFVYRRQLRVSDRRQIDSTIAVLRAARDGMNSWGPSHFGGDGYDATAALNRSQIDFQAVMDGSYYQNFRVPTEPVVSVIEQADKGWIHRKTIEAANLALWRLGIFNQLVQQQTDFNAAHLSEFGDPSTTSAHRNTLANAAKKVSNMIHGDAIGDTRWYPNLITEIDRNIQALEQRKKRWWSRRGFPTEGHDE